MKLKKNEFPLIPLKELVIFPHVATPFFVGREKSINAVQEAMAKDRMAFVACQKTQTENPAEEDIYEYGTLVHIVQLLKLPDETFRLLTEGQARGRILKYTKKKPSLHVQVKLFPEAGTVSEDEYSFMQTLQTAFSRYLKYHKKIPSEIIASIENAEYPSKLIDLIATHVPLKTEQKINILSLENTKERIEQLSILLEAENEIAVLQNRIHTKVRKRLEKGQRDYFLNEQLREINKELGKNEADPSGVKELEEKFKKLVLSEEVRQKGEQELKRLSRLAPMSPESGVLRTYLEWLTDLPWNEKSKDNKDIEKAAAILDEDHYNMKKAKERILDFIAVCQLKEKLKGPILCFVGPPGTGKTSLGRSVARALGREFIRISLGGVKDEAEIRGHRKTYVGALPGKILQSMKKAATINPVFLLDEIDKLSNDFRGDPASALLEVLDPEQNSSFLDHYLEVTYDLSNVMFITTANSIHTIPPALRDRMEIIPIPGYTDFEKLRIAQDFIIPKQLEENGLSWADVQFQKSAILKIIRSYTMESGVRNLEREIGNTIRKIARKAIKAGFSSQSKKREDSVFKSIVTEKSIKKYLGNEKYQEDLIFTDSRPGLAYGLAWTEQGGTLLPIEVAVFEGREQLILTGNLGEVMKESAQTALSFLHSHYNRYNLPSDFYRVNNIHVHVPEGAIPKDGPSAGITITSAILSALTGISVRSGYAMTGEITLTGRILPIGGVKEKVLAAYRNKMMNVLLPQGNKKDIDELPKEVRNTISFVFPDSIEEAIEILFPGAFLTRKK